MEKWRLTPFRANPYGYTKKRGSPSTSGTLKRTLYSGAWYGRVAQLKGAGEHTDARMQPMIASPERRFEASRLWTGRESDPTAMDKRIQQQQAQILYR